MTAEWTSKDKFKRTTQEGDVLISSNGQRYIAKTQQTFFAFDYNISALIREVLENYRSGAGEPSNEEIAFMLGIYK